MKYKKLIIMDIILFSGIFLIIFLPFYLMDLKLLIIFSLSFGLALDLCFLYAVIDSLRSDHKWIVIADFNSCYEGIFELILFIIIAGFESLAIIIVFIII